MLDRYTETALTDDQSSSGRYATEDQRVEKGIVYNSSLRNESVEEAILPGKEGSVMYTSKEHIVIWGSCAKICSDRK